MVEGSEEIALYYIGVQGHLSFSLPHQLQSDAIAKRMSIMTQRDLPPDAVIIVRAHSMEEAQARVTAWHDQQVAKHALRMEALRAHYDTHDTSNELRAALENGTAVYEDGEPT